MSSCKLIFSAWLTALAVSLTPLPLVANPAAVECHPGNAAFAPGQILEAANTSQSVFPDLRLVETNKNIAVEELRGEAAIAHLQNLKSRHQGAFKAAQAGLRQRGFSPTTKVYVQRTVSLASSDYSQGDLQIGLAQDYSEQSSGGEILFWSWTDGDDSTWEGTIYVNIYGKGASTWEGQIDASTSEHPWNYVNITWSEDLEPLIQQAQQTPKPGAQVASLTPADVIFPEEIPQSYALAKTWLQRAQDWRRCVVARCTAAAIGCIATNGGWAGCWGAVCTGMQVGCAISAW